MSSKIVKMRMCIDYERKSQTLLHKTHKHKHKRKFWFKIDRRFVCRKRTKVIIVANIHVIILYTWSMAHIWVRAIFIFIHRFPFSIFTSIKMIFFLLLLISFQESVSLNEIKNLIRSFSIRYFLQLIHTIKTENTKKIKRKKYVSMYKNSNDW